MAAPDFDKSDWRNVQDTLGLDFPNIPYYIDAEAGVKMTQSKAIFKYLARKHNLEAKTDEEFNRQEMILFQSMDFHHEFFVLAYDPNFEKLKPGFLKALPDKLKQFELFLGDRPFFVGDKVNYVDFNIYEALDCHLVLESTCLDEFPNLKAFTRRIAELPGIKEFINSKEYIREPMCTRAACYSAGN